MPVLNVSSDLTLTGNLGFDQQRLKISNDGAVVDFSDAVLHSNVYPATQNPYPFLIELQGHNDVIVRGGTIIRHDDPAITWGQSYMTNSAGFLVGRGDGSIIIDGLRLHNTHDGIRSSSTPSYVQNITVQTVYATHIRDDVIQNDGFNNMTINNSLFDGVFVGFSAVNSGDGSPGIPDPVVTIRDTIVRLETMPGEHHNKLFKWWDGRAPELVLENNIFVVGDGGVSLPPMHKIAHAANNILIWMGEGPFLHDLPEGFTLIVGDDSIFREARDAWLVRHGYDPDGSLAESLHAPELNGGSPPPELSYVSEMAGFVPVVDGHIGEFQNAPSMKLGDHTLYALWDADALYIAASIIDDRVDAAITSRDGRLWTEDSLEVFIDPDNDGGSQMDDGDRQFIVNALGTQFDADAAGAAWNEAWSAAAVTTADGYTVELRIPWSALGVTPESGASYGFSFAINDKDGSAKTQMLWDGSVGGFRVPDKWGIVSLSAETVAGPPVNIFIGTDGADALYGTMVDDLLDGRAGDDVIRGKSGNDLIFGGRGKDALIGGGGNDRLFGNRGVDELRGGADDDLLNGGDGKDVLTGGAGRDTFQIDRMDQGVDRILDFKAGPAGDVLDLSSLLDFSGDDDFNDFVQLREVKGNTRVDVDTGGDGAHFITVFNLIGTTGLSLNTLVDHGNVQLTAPVS